MPSLVLINGAPGSGKSTIASLLAARRPMALALDVDSLKHALGQWDADPYESGLQARRLALAVAAQNLRDGHSVLIGQFLARPEFIERLDELASDCSVPFIEIILELDGPQLAARLSGRQEQPNRPEHAQNNRLVGPRDAEGLAHQMRALASRRPHALTVNASGSPAEVVERVERHIQW